MRESSKERNPHSCDKKRGPDNLQATEKDLSNRKRETLAVGSLLPLPCLTCIRVYTMPANTCGASRQQNTHSQKEKLNENTSSAHIDLYMVKFVGFKNKPCHHSNIESVCNSDVPLSSERGSALLTCVGVQCETRANPSRVASWTPTTISPPSSANTQILET